MRTVPRAACINDLSGFGRCSLTTALPVLSVMGVQACPVPTAVLSKHTGFPAFSFHDLTDTLPAFFETWSDLDFDMIYSGFLGSVGQISIVRDFFTRERRKNPGCRILLDPVMGDDGKRYRTYTAALCDAMRELVSHADIITPNITEACLLTDTPYHGESLQRSEAQTLAEKLLKLGCGAVVITGLVQENMIGNLTCDGNSVSYTQVHRTECLFSGTGDLFASVLCGALCRGCTLPDAVTIAGNFLSDVTSYTLRQNTPAQEGVLFEPLLTKLEGYLNAANETTR
ncbi:MAG: pyridoxamine kinase [Oscillospiraceae bacterium]|nr:pyridoxamine kinase [Oscillospiraceae bacterium]